MKHPFLHIHRLLMKTLWPFFGVHFCRRSLLGMQTFLKKDLIDNPIYVRLFSNL